MGGTIFTLSGATYQLDSHNQVTVGGVTYTYNSGTGGATVAVGNAITKSIDFVNEVIPTSLDFQSSYSSAFHITVDTSNIMTGTSGNYKGNNQVMMALGSALTTKSAGNLYGLGVSDSARAWQTAFSNLTRLIDNSTDEVSKQRSEYAAKINAISYNLGNLQSQSTNSQLSKSNISDADFAKETAKLTKGSIQEQAGAALLAQANQSSGLVMNLLSNSFSNNYDMRNYV